MAEERQFRRFMIESPHKEEECALIVGEVRHMGYLHHFEWGCKDGVHVGWAILEAEDADQARMVVPSMVRKEARVVGLTKWFEEDFDDNE